MGCRLEIYCNEKDAAVMIDAARSFGVEAQVIGRVKHAAKPKLLIISGGEEIVYAG